MITKEQLEKWYDDGNRPLSEEKKRDLKDLIISWNKLSENFKRMKFIEKIPYPKQWKERTKEEIMEVITGLDIYSIKKWQDLRTK